MHIAERYSHKDGESFIRQRYPHLLQDIETIVASVDAERYREKISEEKTMRGRVLYAPTSLNAAFETELRRYGWEQPRIPVDYPSGQRSGYREMDGVKGGLGVEIQFGKYAFLTYDIIAKMVIFARRGYISAGIEVCPMKTMTDQMSTGIGNFHQLVWDLQARGVGDIDIPVLVLGIEP
jgi:hypothetical protein